MPPAYPSVRNTVEENAPEFPYVQMDPLEMDVQVEPLETDASSHDGEDKEVDFEHPFRNQSFAKCFIADKSRCVHRSFFAAVILIVIVASVAVVKVRDDLFLRAASPDYYLRDSSAYVAFLFWGDAGTDDLLLNFSSTGQRSAYGSQLTSTDGWENICPYASMKLFVSGETDERCSYLNPDGYIQGCTAGFYQPNGDTEQNPLPCPDGFMCPQNFLCTVACVPGSQCFNSTLAPTLGRCNYPNTMEGGRPVDPLEVFIPSNLTAETSQSSSELVCPGSDNMYLCRGGFYCETALKSQSCPEGHYCPIGSIVPKKCAAIAKCPPRAQYPSYGEHVIQISFGLIFTFFVSLTCFRNIRDHLREKRRTGRRILRIERQRRQVVSEEESVPSRRVHLLSEDQDEVDEDALNMMGVERPRTLSESRILEDECPEPLSSLRNKRDTMIELTFERLGLELRSNGAKVLNGVSGSCQPGRVTAIMGPSGAGKTTLMNTLAGRATYGRRFGTLLVNGINDSVVSYSDLVGFVPQDDIMHDDLTVKESLNFIAALRLPAKLCDASLEAVVADVMAVLEIDRIAHSIIGNVETRGISGGQRKRVNIGMEMVADPSLLFLDEPTSGLDSSTSYAVVDALKKLSRKGANVIVVLHQPSWQIFEKFDNVILLAPGGSSAFVGPASDAMAFFESIGFSCPPLVNPADFFMDVVAGKFKREDDQAICTEDLVELWEDRQEHQLPKPWVSDMPVRPLCAKTLLDIQPAGFWRSLRFFIARATTQHLRASHQLFSDIMLEAFAGVLVGVLYPHVSFHEMKGWLSFMVLALGLTLSITSLRVFGHERVVFWREAAPGSGMGLDMFAYFLAKNIVEIPRLIVLTLFFVLAFYPIVTPNLIWYYCWGYSCAAAFAIAGFAYLMSVALSPLKAQLCTVIYVLVALMFSGLATSLQDLHNNFMFKAVSYLSIMRWLSELVYLQDVYSLTLAWRMPPPYYSEATQYSALQWIMILGYTPLSAALALNVSILILLGITFRILAFISLILFNRDKRGLPTLTQMCFYWIVNPLDDWGRARREKSAQKRQRHRSVLLASSNLEAQRVEDWQTVSV